MSQPIQVNEVTSSTDTDYSFESHVAEQIWREIQAAEAPYDDLSDDPSVESGDESLEGPGEYYSDPEEIDSEPDVGAQSDSEQEGSEPVDPADDPAVISSDEGSDLLRHDAFEGITARSKRPSILHSTF